MNNIMQLMNMMKGSSNPMAMMQQMAGQNPMMKMAMEMTNGKSEDQIKQVVQNLANQKGIDMNQLQQVASQFNIKL